MRIFSAGIITETNTFAPWPTGLRGFEEGGLFHGNASRDATGMERQVVRVFRDLAQADGHAFVEGLFATAQPSGPTLQRDWESLRDDIVGAVAGQGPFDVILLLLHGAMVATACDDCEADLVARLRALCGPHTVIGVELDPHCHLSQALLDVADAVILMKEYPHTDYVPRARELYALCTAQAAGKVRPCQALFDLRMIGFYPTGTATMAALLHAMREAERRPGILSVSFVHGFPWGDTADTGSKMLVIADGAPELAARTAEELGMQVYRQREALLPRMLATAAALDEAASLPGLTVLADTADNAGGGAPGDNVGLLRAMLARGVTQAAFGAVWDPMAVQACVEAGIGARFQLRLGGKCGVASGEALDLPVTVRAIRERHDQAGLGLSRCLMGTSVWLACEGVDVVVNTVRTQVFSPDAFTGLGIDLHGKRLVAVKSSNHFRAGFAPLAAHMIAVATTGAIQMDFARIDYRRRRDLHFFPRVHDPLARGD